MRMILFIANTQAQLINAANLASTVFRNVECDLYYKKTFEDKASILHSMGCFNNIYAIPWGQEEEPVSMVRKNIRRLSYIMKSNKIIEKFPSSPYNYTDFFISGRTLKLIVLYYAAKKINKKLCLNLYEEGLFEYCELMEKRLLFRIMVSYLIWGRYYLEDCKRMYVYRPDIVNSRWRNIQILQIPSMQTNQRFVHAINQAWSYKSKALGVVKGYMIFFDQSYGYEELENKQRELLQFVSECAGVERIIIKLHPRSKEFKYGKKYKYFSYSYPIEIIALNEDIEKNVFISLQSSAAINMKIMFHMPSPVIMLSNLVLWPKGINATGNSVIKRLASQDKSFFAPDTKEQLKSILQRIQLPEKEGSFVY